MATNVSNRTGNVKNLRAHSLRLADGTKVRKSTKEKRELLKNAKAA